ncbi:MAG: hypothetical protein J6W38_13150 [Prevotella sp.]|nr:hypothetical protein [Prevotella sp.]
MGKRKFFFVLLLAQLPFVGWAQQKNYDGQHVSIKQTTGDSIQYDLNGTWKFQPVIKDGKAVWSFLMPVDVNENGVYDVEELNILQEKFAINDVESISFRSSEYDEKEVRSALIEFYQAMDGDNWYNNENWCSDKPLEEWYGITTFGRPYVAYLSLKDNNLNGELPECLQKIGPYVWLDLRYNNITGVLPDFISNNYILGVLYLSDCAFSGQIPVSLVSTMDRIDLLFIENNYFSGKIPPEVATHDRFVDFWPSILVQKSGGIDVSDIVIPALKITVNDTNGNAVSFEDVYNNNEYTLLYEWGCGDPSSLAFNETLSVVYNAYKDKGLEVIGIHRYFEGQIQGYLSSHDIPWKNVLYDDLEVVRPNSLFTRCSFPALFLVDKNGNIVFNSLADKDFKTPYSDMKPGLIPFLEDHLGIVELGFYTSTDYSRDGEVTILQTAIAGQGIDLVFVGEGFTDTTIDDGTFDQRMTEALEQFFAYEPYTSLRDRFNVYAVKTVSPNAEFFGANVTHAIDEDIAKALEYASKVPNLKEGCPMYVNVIYNQPSGGRSYCTMFEDNSYVCFAMDGVSSVLNHEAGGHGIGKLFDEYVEQGNESMTLPEDNKTEMESKWTTFGWGANVDWRSDPTEVKWSKFISDSRYADERIGVYQGSYLYGLGAYRPTENSMMRYNDTPFNAPSREAIYKNVMKLSEGDSWTYDYESFVAFDAAGHQQFVNALNPNAARQKRAPKIQQVNQRTDPPVFLKGTWQDALNKNKK